MSKKSRRYKSIDTIRGLAMAWMIFGHLIDWWSSPADNWIVIFTHRTCEPFGASAFLFISGISITLSFRKSMNKAAIFEEFSKKTAIYEYMFRTFLVFLIGIAYNVFVAIGAGDMSIIWSWFILQTVAVCFFLTLPLLYAPKVARVVISIFMLFGNLLLVDFLLPFEGTNTLHGVLFYILYNPLNLVPILYFFPFFLFGTIFGDLLSDIESSGASDHQKTLAYRKKVIFPGLVIGTSCLIYVLVFFYPDFVIRRTYPWIFYTIAVHFLLFSLLLGFEEYELYRKEKRHRFLYYYSYYSLTIFLTHYPLYFLFFGQLNAWLVVIAAATAFVVIGLILRFLHDKFGPELALKVHISRIATSLAERLEGRRIKKG